MTAVICVSQYFTNKQNVRSFGTIFNTKLLKSDFINQLFEDEEYLVRELTTDLKLLLSTLKLNLRMKCKEDFKQYFCKENANMGLHSVSKDFIFQSVWTALKDIIPNKLFTGKNTKIFRSLIEEIIYSMRRQHFILLKFIDKWDFSSSLWKPPHFLSKQILCHILIWIFKNILSTMICLNFYVTTCKMDGDENKLHYFWKHQWQSFYDKKLSEMIFARVITKYNQYSMGKKIKSKISLSEWTKLRSMKKEIPKLHFILKNNNDYRPIVRYRSDSQNTAEKYKMKERLKVLKILTGKPPKRFEDQFNALYKNWIKLNKPKLYFVKSDLSNAFGCVNKDKLLKILCERHSWFQNSEKNSDLRKKIAVQFKEIIAEYRKPLFVRAGSTVFEWKEGLVQGYKYSPALSELYYRHLDEIYFSEHLRETQNQIKFFRRVVDDYLYVTNSLDDAHAFLKALSNYRNVNYSKTFVNFEQPHIQLSDEITFLGYQYNTKSLEVSRASNHFAGQMCYKIAFTSAISDLAKFLENRIGQSANPINRHLFNFLYNSEELIWNHIFTTYCMSANKFCTTLAILTNENEMCHYLSIYKKKVAVKLTNSIIETLMRNKPADFQFIFCINHFQHLAWQALYICAKSTSKCSILIPLINIEVARTNCLFGKWREHGNYISSSGEIQHKANKNVCRRSDFRMFVKILELPKNMECYNHKRVLNKIK